MVATGQLMIQKKSLNASGIPESLFGEKKNLKKSPRMSKLQHHDATISCHKVDLGHFYS